MLKKQEKYKNLMVKPTREIQSKGGKASQKAKRERKQMQEIVSHLINMPLKKGELEEIEALSQQHGKNLTVIEKMFLAQIDRANKGDTRAFQAVIENIPKEKEKDNKLKLRIPASAISKSFVDINRSIDDREYQEYVFKGGRLSTKSSYIAMKLIELIMSNPNTHALAARPYEKTLRDSVFTQLKWAISELGVDDEWKTTTSPMQLVYKPTGQTIYLRGADDPAKIKSIKPPFGYIAFLWFEELDQFKGEEQIRNVQQSVLRGGDISLVFKSFNPPKSRSAWANRYVELPKPNMIVHHSTYKETPRSWIGDFALDEAEILKELNEKAYLNEYLGEVIGDGSHVFDNIVEREITDDEIATFEYIYTGQDWGWFPDPNRLVRMSYDANNRKLFIYLEKNGNKMNNETWAEYIREDVGTDYTITADSAEQKTINDFKDLGFNMHPAKKGPNSVHLGIKWLQGLTEIVIDSRRCPLTYQEFRDYEFEKDKEGNPITAYPDVNNHSIDAVRYAMEVVSRRKGL